MTPLRPQMPTAEEQLRAERQTVAYEMLAGDWSERLLEVMKTRVKESRLKKWGPPDTSANSFADMARQYSTPGLYNSAPKVSHAAPMSALLVGPGGHMETMGYWTTMQAVQYLCNGMGDYFVAHAHVDGRLVARTVRPQNVLLVPHPLIPGEYSGLMELRLRPDPVTGDWDYFWDLYDLGSWREDLKTGRILEVLSPPRFAIVRGVRKEGEWEDASALFSLPPGGQVGEAYPYRRKLGRPIIPYTRYRTARWEGMWGIQEKRDARGGAMLVAQAWTYAHSCARDATGSAVIIAGLRPIVTQAQGGGQQARVVSIDVEPGQLMYHDYASDGGQQAFVQEVGPGARLPDVLDYAERLEERQAVRWGLSASDISKGGSDPQSGAALLISRQAKREFALRTQPLFRESDLHALMVYSVLLRTFAGVDVPEEGYSLDYQEIELSSDELAAERADIDWELEHGHTSRVTAYMRRHPGVTEADAIARIVHEKVLEAALEKAVAEAKAAAGIVDPEPVPPPAPPSPTPTPTPPINDAPHVS